MTRSSPATLAVAADYADAMLVARRARRILFLFLLLILVGQMGIFFAVKYSPALHLHSADGTRTDNARHLLSLFEQFTAAANFLGVVLPLALSVVLLLIVTIMLVGRLVGVSHVTSAFCWCVVLTVFLFPWQALLNSRVVQASAQVYIGQMPTTQPETVPASTDVRIPGALYTWPELVKDYEFSNADTLPAISKWWRFAGYPFVMLIILLMVQTRSGRGLKFALGEAEVHVEVTPTPA